jgi:hypothetical protein
VRRSGLKNQGLALFFKRKAFWPDVDSAALAIKNSESSG